MILILPSHIKGCPNSMPSWLHACISMSAAFYQGSEEKCALQAQTMKGKAAEVRMEGVHRPSLNSIPVMFFGTLEIAWISPSDLSSWRDGIKAKMHTKPKGRKAFENSLRQVCPALPGSPHQNAPCFHLQQEDTEGKKFVHSACIHCQAPGLLALPPDATGNL